MGEARTDIYGYNARSELVSSARAGGAPSPATEHEYAYDPIGNRLTSSDLGESRTYTANNLNQYTGISDGVDTFVPQFDDDGDQTLIQTKTGIWSVFYNGENRPTLWTSGSTNVVMSFDRMGRRVEYTETVGNVTNAHHTFVYDGYLQIADNAGNRYVWDPTEPVATRPLVWIHNADTYSYTHDGNKNVSELIDDNGAVTAHYEYAPFGDVTVTIGSLVSANRFRFSSEYADDALGLVRYADRHYGPLSGRWTGRDRAWKLSGSALYAFCLNNPENYFDVAGKMPMRWPITSDNFGKEHLKPYNFIIDVSIIPPFSPPYSEMACTCPNGSTKGVKQNSLNYERMDNKCTVPWYSVPLVLIFGGTVDTDNPYQSEYFGFTLPCVNHDMCYASCGVSKADCDRLFESDMLTICELEANPVRKALCYSWAEIYVHMVEKFGDSPLAGSQKWSSLQQGACEACCCE